MNAYFPDQSTSHEAIFASLRAKLCREVSGSAMLLALLQRVNSMQESHTEPEAFKASFDDFVARADDHISVVRPFFPCWCVFFHLTPASSANPTVRSAMPLGRERALFR